jgi:hypothetical protein
MKRFKRLLRSTEGSSSKTSGPALEHPQGLNVLSEGTDPIVESVLSCIPVVIVLRGI